MSSAFLRGFGLNKRYNVKPIKSKTTPCKVVFKSEYINPLKDIKAPDKITKINKNLEIRKLLIKCFQLIVI